MEDKTQNDVEDSTQDDVEGKAQNDVEDKTGLCQRDLILMMIHYIQFIFGAIGKPQNNSFVQQHYLHRY